MNMSNELIMNKLLRKRKKQKNFIFYRKINVAVLVKGKCFRVISTRTTYYPVKMLLGNCGLILYIADTR